MEHDKNAVINDNDGIVGDNETTMDVDCEETTPNPYVLAHNMRVVQHKQQLTEVERSAHKL
jgi:hypothetical protein